MPFNEHHNPHSPGFEFERSSDLYYEIPLPGGRILTIWDGKLTGLTDAGVSVISRQKLFVERAGPFGTGEERWLDLPVASFGFTDEEGSYRDLSGMALMANIHGYAAVRFYYNPKGQLASYYDTDLKIEDDCFGYLKRNHLVIEAVNQLPRQISIENTWNNFFFWLGRTDQPFSLVEVSSTNRRSGPSAKNFLSLLK